MTFLYAWRLVTRNPARSAAYLFSLALAVGLFAGILFFVDATAREMTATALAPVKLDIVAHGTKPDVNVADTITKIEAQRGVRLAEPVIATDFSSAQKVGSAQPSPSGRLFALQPSYFQRLDLLQISEGKVDPAGAMVSEAMAIAQKLKIGDRVQLSFSAISKTVELPVTGIVNMDGAEVLFSTANEAENAIKYTPAGGKVVIQVAPRGEQAAVMVRDTGVGIAAEHLPHLFERFYRVDSARTRASGGFGLGLAIAHAIVQAHQGQLQVQSVVNEGTTFTVILPLQPPE